MKIYETSLKGVLLIEPDIFEDERGIFFESYNKRKLETLPDFVQDNESISHKNVIRGLHLQKPPYAQAKLCRVVHGRALDVVVDIRKNSPTYGKYFSIELSAKNKLIIYIPIGFAHGFLSLEDNTIFLYKCSNFYNKNSEVTIIWNDKDIGINWGIENPILSPKDQAGIALNEFDTPFVLE